LAAEVALLDEVRGKLGARQFSDALGAVDRYRREFPRGELSRDADVLAIEIWSAAGEREKAAQGAADFLQRYPRDPHAARVRRIAEH
jgi:outer membrane protein assembly factor BamD (BamD/ComL family)